MGRSFLVMVIFVVCLMPSAMGRIVNGAATSKYPGVQLARTKTGAPSCTLQFVSDTTAITAAHCLGDLAYDDCQVTLQDVQDHYQGRVNPSICASYYRCNIWVKDQDGNLIEANSCFAPKASYITRWILNYVAYQRLLYRQPVLTSSESAFTWSPYDLAVVVFPKETSKKLRIAKEDFLKVSRVKPEVGLRSVAVGFGHNTGQRPDSQGAGKKRTGTNRVAEFAYGVIRVDGKQKQENDDGKEVSLGPGDSGGPLFSDEEKDRGRVVGVASCVALAEEKPGTGFSYYASVYSQVADRLFRDARDCRSDKILNTSIGNCADDIVALSE